MIRHVSVHDSLPHSTAFTRFGEQECSIDSAPLAAVQSVFFGQILVFCGQHYSSVFLVNGQ